MPTSSSSTPAANDRRHRLLRGPRQTFVRQMQPGGRVTYCRSSPTPTPSPQRSLDDQDARTEDDGSPLPDLHQPTSPRHARVATAYDLRSDGANGSTRSSSAVPRHGSREWASGSQTSRITLHPSAPLPQLSPNARTHADWPLNHSSTSSRVSPLREWDSLSACEGASIYAQQGCLSPIPSGCYFEGEAVHDGMSSGRQSPSGFPSSHHNTSWRHVQADDGEYQDDLLASPMVGCGTGIWPLVFSGTNAAGGGDEAGAVQASPTTPSLECPLVVRELRRDSGGGNLRINHYHVLKEVGRGASGKVLLAYDEKDRRLVAIKVVRRADNKPRIGGPSIAQKQYASFLREVNLLKKLRHKNILSVYEVIDDPSAESMYLVMQYVDQGPIAQIELKEGSEYVCEPIHPLDLTAKAGKILAALEYLHRHNVVHRDIKPDNILVSRGGDVYLADFGVAETFDAGFRERMEKMMEQTMTHSTALNMAGAHAGGPVVLGAKGTPLFLAPELWSGQQSYGKPVDVWALGVTLYTLLTGRLPFRNLDEIANPDLPLIPTEYGAGWSQLLRGMLDRNPQVRLTAKDAMEQLRAIAANSAEELPQWATQDGTAESSVSCIYLSTPSLMANVSRRSASISMSFQHRPYNSTNFAHSGRGNPWQNSHRSGALPVLHRNSSSAGQPALLTSVSAASASGEATHHDLRSPLSGADDDESWDAWSAAPPLPAIHTPTCNNGGCSVATSSSTRLPSHVSGPVASSVYSSSRSPTPLRGWETKASV